MIRAINKRKLNIYKIIPVVAKQKIFKRRKQQFSIEQYGLKRLVDSTSECIPEILRLTLQNVQIVSLKR